MTPSAEDPAAEDDTPDTLVAEVAGRPFTPREVAAAISIGVVALLVSGLMGLLLGALAQEGRLSASGIGLAAMLEALATGLVTGLAGIFLKPRRLRRVGVVAAILLVIVDLATARASGSGVLLARMLAGIPEGALLWIAIGLISRTVTPERWAAFLFTGMGVTQLAAATALSLFILPRFGASGGYVALAACVTLAIPLAFFAPSQMGKVEGHEGDTSGAPPLRGWLALLGTLCFSASLSSVGVYVIPLALEAGLSTAVGRTAISVGLGFQILGGVLATLLAGRVRYVVIFSVCGPVFLATWLTYGLSAQAVLFVALSGFAGLCGMLAGPFLLPMTVEADPSRRAAMQSGAVQLLAGAMGPFLASLVVHDNNVRGVLVLGSGLLLAGLTIIALLHRTAHLERRAVRAPA